MPSVASEVCSCCFFLLSTANIAKIAAIQTALKTILIKLTYMYVSFINIVLSAVWIAAILAIFAVLNKKKQQLQTSDATDGISEIFRSCLISSTALIPKMSL